MTVESASGDGAGRRVGAGGGCVRGLCVWASGGVGGGAGRGGRRARGGGGGIGERGMGGYHGKSGVRLFQHMKPVLSRGTKLDPSLAYPPYTEKKEKLFRKLL